MASQAASAPIAPVKPAEQAGGVAETVRTVKTLDAKVVPHLTKIFEIHAGKDKKWHKDQVLTFLKHVQGDSIEDVPKEVSAKEELDFHDFLTWMTSPASSITAPPEKEDMSWPLSSYFISSSHNTYLTGNQLYSESSTDAYKNVLLRGCRCIEIDVWDGDDSDFEDSSDSSDEGSGLSPQEKKEANTRKNAERLKTLKEKLPDTLSSRLQKTTLGKKLDDKIKTGSKPAAAGPPTPAEAHVKHAATAPLPTPKAAVVEPRVLHGYTLTKEVSFRDVCVSIRDNAFKATDLPLIVSIEVHCSTAQQEIMVKIMEQVWKGHLVAPPDGEAKELPRPGDLKNKILVKVKYVPPHPPEVAKPGAVPEADAKKPADAQKKRQKAKVIPSLSTLGIYTKGVSFKSLTQPEATMPTHVFSLSEKGVMEVHEKSSQELFHHNKHYMMRTYPSGLRVNSSNLDPAVFWRRGIQIVALNFQNVDEGIHLNEGMFAGTGGYVLKPEGYRVGQNKGTDAQSCKILRKTLDLTITVFAAQSLPLPSKSDSAKKFTPYVKVEIHVEDLAERQGGPIEGDGKEKEGEYKAKTKTMKGCDVDFKGQQLKFGAIPGVVDKLTFVRFTVRDEEFGRDDLAAWACIRLDRLRNGYRFVSLMDSNGNPTDGVILVKVEKKLT